MDNIHILSCYLPGLQLDREHLHRERKSEGQGEGAERWGE